MKSSVVLLLGVLFTEIAVEGMAATAEIAVERIKIRDASGYGVLLVLKDFWDKPLWWGLVKTPEGKADYPLKTQIGTTLCPNPCKAVATDLTREDYMALYSEFRLKRLEEDLATIRNQLRAICSRVPAAC